MSIAKRLLLLIALSIIGLLGIAGIGLTQINHINDNLVEATDNTIPSLDVLAGINTNFLRFRAQLLYHVLSTDSSVMADFERQLNASRGSVGEGLERYEKLVSDSKDASYLENSRKLFAQYFAEADKALTLSRQNRNIEARDHLLGPGFVIAKQLIENMAAHAKYNEELANIEKKKAAEAYSQAKISMLLGASFFACLIIGIGLFTYKHVAGSLQSMSSLFARIEQSLDFTGRIPVTGNDEVSTTSASFNRLLDRLQHSLREVSLQAHAVSESAAKVSSASEQMSSASSHQSESASSMAATMEEMTVSINHVADRAGEADTLSRSSGQLAQDGTQIIGEAVLGIDSIATTVHTAAAQISQLEQNSERVNSVIAVIKEVADQTNLLALNAAIEAARAGEQGRGFAVVADEVRKLAERTSQSTHEIASTINEMQNGAQSAVLSIQAMVSRVENGVALARKANAAIGEIGKSSEDAVHMVADISEAIREQSSASTSLAQEVEKIAQMSEENSAAAHSTANTANELARLSQSLQNVVAQYRV